MTDLTADRAAVDALAARLRPEFPMLGRALDGQPLAFLDSASTTPKPRAVIDAVVHYYEHCTANVHRGVHALGQEATQLYDAARIEAAGLIGAAPDEIVFVRGTTEAINLVSHSMSLGSEDEVVFPASEHHANWLPWRVKARPVPMAIDPDGVPRWETLESLLTKKTRLVSIGHVSNVTGCIAPVDEVVRIAHAHGIPVLLDAAQSLSHLPIDVRKLDVDFLAASSHKAFGPSGVGILYAKRERLRDFPLYQVGGGMVAMNKDVLGSEPSHFIPRDVPFRFEAGTPAIESTIGFGAAIRWMRAIGLETIQKHDVAMARYLVSRLRELPGVRVLAADVPADKRIALATFVVDAPGMTQENVARALCDMFGVCVSGGFHCTHVLHARAKLEGTVRASPHVFNTTGEIDRLVEGVREIAS
ncbi:MAG TPA: cysteine desulfurase [Polyangiaceae bacterium]|nr:cysteine desulfurase [Polyangiaceae bacterium]